MSTERHPSAGEPSSAEPETLPERSRAVTAPNGHTHQRRDAPTFLAPQLPQTLVDRPRLAGLLGRLSGAAWTLVVGPPGSGKTTLVRSWMDEHIESWAWVTLTSTRYRQFGLAEKIVRAVQGACPADPLDTIDAIGDDGVADVDLLNRLVDELSLGRVAPIVLVIDDAHLLGADEWELMRRLIIQLPAALHLVLLARSEPPIPLARERATGRVVTLRPADLAFDLAETASLLELVAGTRSAAAARQLHDTTEGWAAGIRLASLAIRDGVAAESLLDRLGHRESTVAEFLVEEVLDHLPTDRRTDLERLSFLRLLEPELCDAITGRSDAREMLYQLSVDGSFVVRVEGVIDRYRFHPLLAVLLRHELERVDPDAVRATHLAAADWLFANDRPIESIEHLLGAGEHERAHRLLMDFFRPLYIGTHRHDIDRWLNAIPDDVITERPERALEHCVALALVAHDQAARWRRYCLEHLPPDDDWLMSRLEAIEALEYIVDGELEEARASWKRSLRRRPAHRTEPIDEVLQSWSIRLGAMFDDAAAAVESARRFQESRRELVTDGPALSVLAGALAAAGDREGAVAVAERAVDMWRAVGEPDLPGMLDALVVLAAAARESDDFAAADDLLDTALSVVPEWAPGPNTLTMIPLVERARLAHDRGDSSWRAQLLGLAEVLRARGRPPDVVEWVDRARRDLEAAGESSPPARANSSAAILTEDLTERELTVLELLASHLSMPEIATELYISRHTVKSHVSNIYRKLGASSRSDAVRTARDLRLLT